MSQATILNNQVTWVPTSSVSPNPFQPRIEFNDSTISELADSIKQYGVLQPLTVTEAAPAADGTPQYELIAGERRLRASKMAGMPQVPVIIRVGDTNKERLELAIIENLQREDLNAVDRAKAFLQLAQEFSLSHADIGKRMGKSREYVSNTLRLLALPQYILDALTVKKISEGHTRPLLMLADKPEQQKNLFNDIVNYKMSVRAAEARARKDAQERVRKEHLKADPKLLNLEQKLSNTLKARVAIETAQDGNSGRLVINYFNPDELNDLIKIVSQMTGDTELQNLDIPAPKSNQLKEEQTIESAQGFSLNTGFLNEVSVDDDKGAILEAEEAGRNTPTRFGFDKSSESMSISDTSPVDTLPEVQPLELAGNSHTKSASMVQQTQEALSLSDLLARANKEKKAGLDLDTGSVEAYERDNDIHDTEDDDRETMPIQEHESHIEISNISDEELDKGFAPTEEAKKNDPGLYDALFNFST